MLLSRQSRMHIGAAATAVALLFAAACKPSDPRDPDRWIAELSSGDAQARVKAVRELRKLKATKAAPALAKALSDSAAREDAALALAELGGRESVQPLIEAIDTNVGAGSDAATRAANRTNAKISDALGVLGDAKAAPALLRLARSRDDLVRISAVQALGNLRAAEAVPELTHIVDGDDTPPLLVKKAVVALGQIRDPSGIPALVHALVLERQGVSFISEASYALFQLGESAVEPMLRVAQDEDKEYLAWAKARSRAPAGTYAKAALVLGDLGDKRAVPVLLAKLKYKDPDPSPGTAKLLTNVVRQFAADALGRMRAAEAAKPILELVQTKDPLDEDLVTFATNALVWIGDRTIAPKLVALAGAPGVTRLRILCAQAAALLGEPVLAKSVSALGTGKPGKQTPAECLRDLSALLGNVEVEEAQACARLRTEQQQAFQATLAPLAAAQECAGSAACWAGKLGAHEAPVRARAALELGRAGATEHVAALAKATHDQDLAARLAAIRALEWLSALPAAQPQLKLAAEQIHGQLQSEQGMVHYVKVNEELKRLQARLSRL